MQTRRLPRARTTAFSAFPRTLRAGFATSCYRCAAIRARSGSSKRIVTWSLQYRSKTRRSTSTKSPRPAKRGEGGRRPGEGLRSRRAPTAAPTRNVFTTVVTNIRSTSPSASPPRFRTIEAPLIRPSGTFSPQAGRRDSLSQRVAQLERQLSRVVFLLARPAELHELESAAQRFREVVQPRHRPGAALVVVDFLSRVCLVGHGVLLDSAGHAIPSELVRHECVPRLKIDIHVRELRQSHLRVSPHPFCCAGRRRRRSDLAADLRVARAPRVLAGGAVVQKLIAAIVEVRQLNIRTLWQRVANALRETGAVIEIVRERMRHVFLESLETGERRQRQRLVVDGEAIRHRPSAPRQECSRRVIAAEGRRADRPIELALPLQVCADRPHFFANPRVQRRPRQRVRRRPERSFVLTRRRQEKLSRAKLKAAACDIEIRLGQSRATSSERRRLVARQSRNVHVEVLVRRPVGAELRERECLVAARVEASRTALEPRPRVLVRADTATTQEAVERERLCLRARADGNEDYERCYCVLHGVHFMECADRATAPLRGVRSRWKREISKATDFRHEAVTRSRI